MPSWSAAARTAAWSSVASAGSTTVTPTSTRIRARSSIAWWVARNGVVIPGRKATTTPRLGPVQSAIATWSYARRVAKTP